MPFPGELSAKELNDLLNDADSYDTRTKTDARHKIVRAYIDASVEASTVGHYQRLIQERNEYIAELELRVKVAERAARHVMATGHSGGPTLTGV